MGLLEDYRIDFVYNYFVPAGYNFCSLTVVQIQPAAGSTAYRSRKTGRSVSL